MEPIIEAILESPVPIVSAVGHESDHLVSDLVADHRAATPTHAMEMVIPIRGDYDIMLDDFSSRLEGGLNRWLSRRKERLYNLKLRLASAPLIGMGKARESLLMLNNILTRLTTSHFNAERQRLQRYSTVLEFTNPHAVLKRGYSMVKGEDGMVIRTAAAAASQSSMKLQFHDGELSVAPLKDD
jgi:exodeoxyribonuclease VII large subunit